MRILLKNGGSSTYIKTLNTNKGDTMSLNIRNAHKIAFVLLSVSLFVGCKNRQASYEQVSDKYISVSEKGFGLEPSQAVQEGSQSELPDFNSITEEIHGIAHDVLVNGAPYTDQDAAAFGQLWIDRNDYRVLDMEIGKECDSKDLEQELDSFYQQEMARITMLTRQGARVNPMYMLAKSPYDFAKSKVAYDLTTWLDGSQWGHNPVKVLGTLPATAKATKNFEFDLDTVRIQGQFRCHAMVIKNYMQKAVVAMDQDGDGALSKREINGFTFVPRQLKGSNLPTIFKNTEFKTGSDGYKGYLSGVTYSPYVLESQDKYERFDLDKNGAFDLLDFTVLETVHGLLKYHLTSPGPINNPCYISQSYVVINGVKKDKWFPYFPEFAPYCSLVGTKVPAKLSFKDQYTNYFINFFRLALIK